jgi:hypothetical protein
MIFVIYINPLFLEELDSLSIAMFNYKYSNGNLWISLCGYFIPGVLIMFFSYKHYISSVRKSLGRIAFPLLLISGLAWATITFNRMGREVLNMNILFMMIQTTLTLGLGILAFLLITISPKEFNLSKGSRLWIGILTSIIIIETSLGLFYDEHKTIFSSISYFSYFLVFGVLGLNALQLNSEE